MTLEEFVKYLHRRTGYRFYHQSVRDGYTIYGFVNRFKGHITEENGKFYMLTCYHVSNAILKHPNILHKRILQYASEEYGYFGIYEISLQQDKTTNS